MKNLKLNLPKINFSSDLFVALDLGQQTCGIALGNDDYIVPIINLIHKPKVIYPIIIYLEKLIKTNRIIAISVGYPTHANKINYVNMTFIQEYILNFYQKLCIESRVPVFLINESQTTKEAVSRLTGLEKIMFKHDNNLVAAKLILERFLATLKQNSDFIIN